MGIQANVEAQLAALDAKLGTAFVAKVDGVSGGIINVRAHDDATDFYSSTSASNVAIDVVSNPVVSAALEEVHGQVSLTMTLTNAITIPFVDATGKAAPSKSLTTFNVQLGAIKDNQATPAVLYALTGNFIRAGWNYFLIEGDQSKGLHNPSFVSAVLAASIAKDVSN